MKPKITQREAKLVLKTVGLFALALIGVAHYISTGGGIDELIIIIGAILALSAPDVLEEYDIGPFGNGDDN